MKKVILLLSIFTVIICTSIIAVNAEGETTKSTQAPIINYTVSETEDTWNPITINLDITDDEEIVEVTYVIQNQPRGFPSEGVHDASIPYDLDFRKVAKEKIESFIYGASGKEYEDWLIEVGGDFNKGTIINDFYSNSYEIEIDDEGIETEVYCASTVENNSFTVYKNRRYIVCAVDKTGNKSFKFFSIDNINLPSAKLEFNINDDLSGEYIGTAKLAEITENPNSPTEFIFVCKSPWRWGNIGGGYESARVDYEKYKELNLEIQPINGVYNLNDFGTYIVIMKDDWDNYVIEMFEFKPRVAVSPLELECIRNGNTITVKPDSNATWAKIEYAVCRNIYFNITATSGKKLFEDGINRAIVTDNKFDLVEGDWVIVRGLTTEGFVRFNLIEVNNQKVMLTLEEPSVGGTKIDCSAKNATGANLSGIILVTGYDENGIVVSSYIEECSLDVDETKTYNVDIVGAKTVKAMMLKDFKTIMPIAIPAEVEL